MKIPFLIFLISFFMGIMLYYFTTQIRCNGTIYEGFSISEQERIALGDAWNPGNSGSYLEKTQKTYYLVEVNMTLQEHIENARNKNMELASIHSPEENDHILAVSQGNWSYIGAKRKPGVHNDSGDSSEWRWIDGSKWGSWESSRPPWGPEEPNNGYGQTSPEDAIAMNWGDMQGRWVDISPTDLHYAIYQVNHRSFTLSNVVNSSNKNFILVKALWSWDQHNTNARNHGMELASIHSNDELNAVKAIINPDFGNFIGGKRKKGSTSTTKNNSTWEWSDGTTWSRWAATSTNWAVQEVLPTHDIIMLVSDGLAPNTSIGNTAYALYQYTDRLPVYKTPFPLDKYKQETNEIVTSADDPTLYANVSDVRIDTNLTLENQNVILPHIIGPQHHVTVDECDSGTSCTTLPSVTNAMYTDVSNNANQNVSIDGIYDPDKAIRQSDINVNIDNMNRLDQVKLKSGNDNIKSFCQFNHPYVRCDVSEEDASTFSLKRKTQTLAKINEENISTNIFQIEHNGFGVTLPKCFVDNDGMFTCKSDVEYGDDFHFISNHEDYYNILVDNGTDMKICGYNPDSSYQHLTCDNETNTMPMFQIVPDRQEDTIVQTERYWYLKIGKSYGRELVVTLPRIVQATDEILISDRETYDHVLQIKERKFPFILIENQNPGVGVNKGWSYDVELKIVQKEQNTPEPNFDNFGSFDYTFDPTINIYTNGAYALQLQTVNLGTPRNHCMTMDTQEVKCNETTNITNVYPLDPYAFYIEEHNKGNYKFVSAGDKYPKVCAAEDHSFMCNRLHSYGQVQGPWENIEIAQISNTIFSLKRGSNYAAPDTNGQLKFNSTTSYSLYITPLRHDTLAYTHSARNPIRIDIGNISSDKTYVITLPAVVTNFHQLELSPELANFTLSNRNGNFVKLSPPSSQANTVTSTYIVAYDNNTEVTNAVWNDTIVSGGAYTIENMARDIDAYCYITNRDNFPEMICESKDVRNNTNAINITDTPHVFYLFGTGTGTADEYYIKTVSNKYCLFRTDVYHDIRCEEYENGRDWGFIIKKMTSIPSYDNDVERDIHSYDTYYEPNGTHEKEYTMRFYRGTDYNGLHVNFKSFPEYWMDKEMEIETNSLSYGGCSKDFIKKYCKYAVPSSQSFLNKWSTKYTWDDARNLCPNCLHGEYAHSEDSQMKIRKHDNQFQTTRTYSKTRIANDWFEFKYKRRGAPTNLRYNTDTWTIQFKNNKYCTNNIEDYAEGSRNRVTCLRDKPGSWEMFRILPFLHATIASVKEV